MDRKKLSELQNMSPAELLKAMRNKKKTQASKLETHSEQEQYIATLWSDIFPDKTFDVHSDFFELGGTSLQAVLLLSKIKDKYNVEFDFSLLLKANTIHNQAKLLEDLLSSHVLKYEEYNFQSDIDLAEELEFRPHNLDSQSVNSILMTGVTGFLGIHLLKELLDSTNVELYCLVRDSSPGQGFERISAMAEKYQLHLSNTEKKRIKCISGDLDVPGLKLSDSDYALLKGRIDLIIHSAAQVNFVSPYQRLRQSNVLSFLELLKLAACGRHKAVHFISSIGIFNNLFESLSKIDESTPSSDTAPVSGYFQSKWVCEKISDIARNKGIPISIYRPSGITVNTQSQLTSSDDLTHIFLRLTKALGIYSELETIIDIVPVDYVTKAMVDLMIHQPYGNKNYHLTSGEKVNLNERLANIPKKLGIKKVDYQEYLRKAFTYIRQTDDKQFKALEPLLIGNPLFSGEKPLSLPVFESTITQEMLHFSPDAIMNQTWTALYKNIMEGIIFSNS